MVGLQAMVLGRLGPSTSANQERVLYPAHRPPFFGPGDKDLLPGPLFWRIIPCGWASPIWITWPYRVRVCRLSRRREIRLYGVLRSSEQRGRPDPFEDPASPALHP